MKYESEIEKIKKIAVDALEKVYGYIKGYRDPAVINAFKVELANALSRDLEDSPMKEKRKVRVLVETWSQYKRCNYWLLSIGRLEGSHTLYPLSDAINILGVFSLPFHAADGILCSVKEEEALRWIAEHGGEEVGL